MSQIDLKDKQVALLIWNTEKEEEAHVYVGQIIQGETEQYFLNESMGWKFDLNNEQMLNLTLVPEDMKEAFLNSDYFISLSMGSISGDDTSDYIPTGLKW